MANGIPTITKAELETENGELQDVLNDVWAELVDVDTTTSKAQALEAIDSVCQILNDYDAETYVIEGEGDSDSDDNEAAA